MRGRPRKDRAPATVSPRRRGRQHKAWVDECRWALIQLALLLQGQLTRQISARRAAIRAIWWLNGNPVEARRNAAGKLFLKFNDPRGWLGPDNSFQADIRAIERGMNLTAYEPGDKQKASTKLAGAMVTVAIGRIRVRTTWETGHRTINVQWALERFFQPREADSFDEWSQVIIKELTSAGYPDKAAHLLDGLTSIPSDQERADRLPRLFRPR